MVASPADADDAALMRLIKPVFSIFMKTLYQVFEEYIMDAKKSRGKGFGMNELVKYYEYC